MACFKNCKSSQSCLFLCLRSSFTLIHRLFWALDVRCCLSRWILPAENLQTETCRCRGFSWNTACGALWFYSAVHMRTSAQVLQRFSCWAQRLVDDHEAFFGNEPQQREIQLSYTMLLCYNKDVCVCWPPVWDAVLSWNKRNSTVSLPANPQFSCRHSHCVPSPPRLALQTCLEESDGRPSQTHHPGQR